MSQTPLTAVRRSVLAVFAASLVYTGQSVYAQGLEEVIVTAQKREEGLQEVPIAVEAFSAEQITNLSAQDIGDLGTFTPNVSISKAANQPNYAIRGIGTDDFGIGADPAVGVYQDGVYIGRSGGSKVAFNDIARVEILNGPQGTLFGRNAAAGAIQYVSNKPEEELYGWARGTVGNYNRYQVDGVANVPLADNLFLRTGVLWNRRDGWVDNYYNGKDLMREGDSSIVTQLRWLPTDRLDTNLRLEFDNTDQDSRARSSAVWGPRDNGAGFNKVASDSDLHEKRNLFGASYHLTYEMDWATLTSISSYRWFKLHNPEEKDGSAELYFFFNDLNREHNDQYSQEFRLDGDYGSSFRWTTGVNVAYEHARQTSGIHLTPQSVDKLIAELEIGVPYDSVPPGLPIDLAFTQFPDPFNERTVTSGAQALADDIQYREQTRINAKYRSYAAFSDVTYDITDTWSLTGGLRYTYDDKKFGRFVKFNDYVIAFAFTTETRLDGNGNYDPEGELNFLKQDKNWSKLTPRAVLEWQAQEEVMLYASYTEGYKAGGFNSTADDIFAGPFDPEEVTNYELGMKSSWLDNTVRVNAAVFSYSYDNLQSLEFVDAECLPNSSVGTYLFETSDVEGDGFELNVNWLALPSLELYFNTGYLDAQYTDRQRRQVIDGVCVVKDESGKTFSKSPDLNFTVGANYSYDFSNGSEMVLALAYNYTEGLPQDSCFYVVDNAAEGKSSDVYEFTKVDGKLVISDPSATGDLTEPPFSDCPDTSDQEQLNARLAYNSPERDWTLAAFITNATNWMPDKVGGEPGGLGSQLATAFSDGSPSYGRTAEPRMYGVEFRYNFE
ncbi:MAG: TonB-dependent receptor [Pseudomonadales bacterium]|nr:TonB-dependent receptor [Halioglobus sp.]MCP5131701.1 TonB-dependent receptor [Pseudomonadales bacterium]